MSNTNEKAQSADNLIEQISRNAHITAKLATCLHSEEKGLSDAYESGFREACNWLFDSNNQLKTDLAKSHEKCKAYEEALNRLTPLLSYFVGRFETVDVELNNFDKAMIERSEQALKPNQDE